MQLSTTTQTLTESDVYEYAFIPVPLNQRKNGSHLFFVLAGFTSTLSCFVLGAEIGSALPFWQAIAACFFSDVILILIGTGMGMISANSGWSTAFLAQRILGKSASVIFTILQSFCTVLWIGVNGRLFASTLITVFPNWALPLSVTSLIVILLWAAIASGGFQRLEVISRLALPCCLLLTAYAMIRLFSQMQGTSFLSEAPVNASMTASMASAAVVGNFICGCISTPDTCRFARSSKTVSWVCPCAYATGMFLFHVCGIMIAKAGGFSNFNRSAAALGIMVPLLLCTIICTTTTQNMNIYICSLAMQNIFQKTPLEGNVSHKTAAYLIAGIASALSVSGISSYLVPMMSYFSILMVPLPGMLFGTVCLTHLRKRPAATWYWRTISVWILSICAGFIFLHLNTPLAPLWEMLFATVSYVLLDYCAKSN